MRPPTFRKYVLPQRLASKSFSSLSLRQSGYFLSFPVVTGYGGRQPGQNLNKLRPISTAQTPSRPSPSLAAGPHHLGRVADFPPSPVSARTPEEPREKGPAEPPRLEDGEDSESDHSAPTGPDPTEPQGIDAPLPRCRRKPRRARADRGLPPDEELAKLASAYLEFQRKRWPDIVAAGLLPALDENAIRGMVADFKIAPPHRQSGSGVCGALPQVLQKTRRCLREVLLRQQQPAFDRRPIDQHSGEGRWSRLLCALAVHFRRLLDQRLGCLAARIYLI